VLVAKVGGSLFDLADLGPRLRGWLADQPEQDHLLLPGGGPTADAVRRLDRLHGLGQEAAHWLALRALAVNARFLAELLPAAAVVGTPHEAAAAFRAAKPAVLDAFAFCRLDEASASPLPHTWQATSDAVAARAAVVFGARRLVLLKSVDVPPALGWEEAGRRGLVDPVFAAVLRQAPRLAVEAVNLRGPGGARG